MIGCWFGHNSVLRRWLARKMSVKRSCNRHKWDQCNARCVRCGAWNPRLEQARQEWENRDTEPLSEDEWASMFYE